MLLGLYYAIALWLIGLHFALLIGVISGLITFVPYIGSLTGLMIGTSVAIAQFWPDWKWIVGVVAIFLVGQFVEGNIIAPKLVGERVGLAPGVDHLRDVRLRLPVRLRRLAAGGSDCGGDRGAVPLRAQALSREPDLFRRAADLTATVNRPEPRQLALALDHTESFAREDFLGGPSNASALALVESWPDWASRAVVLTGPEGSGKSHLAAIWGAAAGARFIAARALGEADVPPALATGAVVIEDAAEGGYDERALFHLLNLAREEGAFVLITTRTAPAGWRFAIRDLGSRLKALPHGRAGAARR